MSLLLTGTLGGAAASTTVGKTAVNDFIYVAYGDSSANDGTTSAYVYAGYFDNAGLAFSAAASVTDAIKSKIAIVSLAEIVDVSITDLASGNFTSSKPAGLS